MTEAELREMYEGEGLSYAAIAKRIGRSQCFVRNTAIRYGITPRDPHNEQARLRLSNTRKRLWKEGLLSVPSNFNRNGAKQSEQEKRKRADSNRGKKRTPEQCKRISDANKVAMNRPQTRRKLSESAKKAWADPEIAARQIAATLAASEVHPNGLERRVMALLESSEPGNWRFTGNGSLILGKMCPDFVHQKRNLLVEAFGNYWHEPEDEKKRSDYFRDRGYRTLVVWESDSDEQMTSKIRRFIKEDDFAMGVR